MGLRIWRGNWIQGVQLERVRVQRVPEPGPQQLLHAADAHLHRLMTTASSMHPPMRAHG